MLDLVRVLLAEASNEMEAQMPDNARKLIDACGVLLDIEEGERAADQMEQFLKEAERRASPVKAAPVGDPVGSPVDDQPLTEDDVENMLRALFPNAEIVRLGDEPDTNFPRGGTVFGSMGRTPGVECQCPACTARRRSMN